MVGDNMVHSCDFAQYRGGEVMTKTGNAILQVRQCESVTDK